MTIIKRSGRKEPFSMDKIRDSLAASSDEAKQPLNESDISRIVTELKQILEGKTMTTTQQIIIIIAGLLYTKGFHGVLERYISFRNDRV